MKKLLLTLLVLVIGLSSIKLFAQGKNNQVGIGLQLGDPSGLSLKFYNPGRASVDILAAWDLNNYLFVNVHALYHKPLGNARNANFFYGPGAFLAFRERNRYADYLGLGISGNFGFNVFIDQLEIYAQVTPRLQLIEGTDADVGGGIGLRFYF
jgi:hypothetical protein